MLNPKQYSGQYGGQDFLDMEDSKFLQCIKFMFLNSNKGSLQMKERLEHMIKRLRVITGGDKNDEYNSLYASEVNLESRLNYISLYCLIDRVTGEPKPSLQLLGNICYLIPLLNNFEYLSKSKKVTTIDYPTPAPIEVVIERVKANPSYPSLDEQSNLANQIDTMIDTYGYTHRISDLDNPSLWRSLEMYLFIKGYSLTGNIQKYINGIFREIFQRDLNPRVHQEGRSMAKIVYPKTLKEGAIL